MGYFVTPLPRPYDYVALIETYVYAQRRDYVHGDFREYYTALLQALERQFGIRMSQEGMSHSEKSIWMLFNATVESRLRITTPWDGFLEAGLLHRRLEQAGELGGAVMNASDTIREAADSSREAHNQMLRHLFVIMYGPRDRVVTSQELAAAGFDDSREPRIQNYYDWM